MKMKKILLVGELNQIISSLNQHFATKFQTQMCIDSYDVVKGMTKIFNPDMVVVCLVGMGELDNRIWELFLNNYPQMPVLNVGTSQECESYKNLYESEQFDYVVRPTTLGVLLRKCEEMLKLSDKTVEAEPELPVEEEQEKQCVLAVDDSGVLLRSVKAMLDKEYNVVVANSGMAAMEQARKKHPDLILLDYEMPEWDGRKTLEEIRKDEKLKDIPVVFLTAVADKAHIAAVLELRPSGYLLKPIEQQTLLETIRKALIRI